MQMYVTTSLTLNFRILYYIMQSVFTRAVGVAISRAYHGRSLEVDNEDINAK